MRVALATGLIVVTGLALAARLAPWSSATLAAGPDQPMTPFPTLLPTRPFPTLPPSVPTPSLYTPTPTPTPSATGTASATPMPTSTHEATPSPRATSFLDLEKVNFLPFASQFHRFPGRAVSSGIVGGRR